MSACRAASPSEWPTSPRGSSGNARPPRWSGRPASSRCASKPTPARTRPTSPASALSAGVPTGADRARRMARRSGRSSGSVSLRLAGSPCDRDHRHADGGQRRGLVSWLETLGPGRVQRGPEDPQACRLRCLGRRHIGPVNRLEDGIVCRIRFSVSWTATTGIAPVPALAAAATADISARARGGAGGIVDEDDGRIRDAGVGQSGEPSPHRVGAGFPAGNDLASVSGGWRHRRGESVHRVRGRHHRHRGHARDGEQCVQAPAPDRPAERVVPELVDIGSHPPTTAGGNKHPGQPGRDVGHAVAHAPSRGWAKIIRPATVWRTRVTVIGTSVSMNRLPPSTTIIVPSSR